MEIVEIIQAYETLRSHGLDVSNLFDMSINRSRIEKDKRVGDAPVSKTTQIPTNILDGNTSNQLLFLSQLLNKENAYFGTTTAKEHTKGDEDRKVNDNDDVRVSLQDEKEVSSGCDLAGNSNEKNRDENFEDRGKKLEEYTIRELRQMKVDVEQEYGAGIFEKHILPDIASLLDFKSLKDSIAHYPEGETHENKKCTVEGDDEGVYEKTIEEMIAQQCAILSSKNAAERSTEVKSIGANTNQAVSDNFVASYWDKLTGDSGKLDGIEDDKANPLKPIAKPRMEGGNVVVEVDDAEYRKGIAELQFSVVATLSLQRGEAHPSTMALKTKLEEAWNILDFRLISMGKGIFHVILRSIADQVAVLSKEIIYVKPGVVRFSRWTPGASMQRQNTTMTQAWIRIYNLPLEFRKAQNLFNIAMGVGFPIKIDPLTLSYYHGSFARVLVEIDCAKPLTERVLVSKRNSRNETEFEFFVDIVFEKLPKICTGCYTLGHIIEDCWKTIEEKSKTKNLNAGKTAKQNLNVKGQHNGERPQQFDMQRTDVRGRMIQYPLGTQLGDSAKNYGQLAGKQDHGNEKTGLREDSEAYTGIQQGENEPAWQSVHARQRRLGPVHANQIINEGTASDKIDQHYRSTENLVSVGKSKPWQLENRNRYQQLDRMASDIMANEALKIITEAYEVVFEGKKHKDGSEEKQQDGTREDTEKSIEEHEKEQNAEGDNKLSEAAIQKEKEIETSSTQAKIIQKPRESEGTKNDISPRWADQNWEEEEQDEDVNAKPPLLNVSNKSSTKGCSESPSIASQLGKLDPEKIYWNDDEEIYVHSSGMCFDPAEKVYFTLINPDEGDLRPLYYRQSKGDFKLAVRGELGQSNKIVLEDREWDKSAIYTPLSVGYRPHLLELFKNKFKVGRI